MMKDIRISWTTLFTKEYVWVSNCVRVFQIFCLKEENAQQFWTSECVLNLFIWVLLGCSNMGIVVAIVKLFEVYLQDSGDFWITKLSFSHSSDIRNTRIFRRCSKRSIFKYFKIWKCEYVKYVNMMSKTLSKLSLSCAQTLLNQLEHRHTLNKTAH
jgi:hypothetical protein